MHCRRKVLSRSSPETVDIFRPRSARITRCRMGLKISPQGLGKYTLCPGPGTWLLCELPSPGHLGRWSGLLGWGIDMTWATCLLPRAPPVWGRQAACRLIERGPGALWQPADLQKRKNGQLDRSTRDSWPFYLHWLVIPAVQARGDPLLPQALRSKVSRRLCASS